jgi:hypothetical protein
MADETGFSPNASSAAPRRTVGDIPRHLLACWGAPQISPSPLRSPGRVVLSALFGPISPPFFQPVIDKEPVRRSLSARLLQSVGDEVRQLHYSPAMAIREVRR